MKLIKVLTALSSFSFCRALTSTVPFNNKVDSHVQQLSHQRLSSAKYLTQANGIEERETNSLESRRKILQSGISLVCGSVLSLPSITNAADNAAAIKSIVDDLQTGNDKLKKVPDLLQAGEWDAVRTILKTPPLNYLWNLGDNQNTLIKLSKLTDDPELIDLKDELAISLQMCDQLTYDNAFVYFQPGNGKVKIKEPTDLALKAIKQISDAIEIGKGSL